MIEKLYEINGHKVRIDEDGEVNIEFKDPIPVKEPKIKTWCGPVKVCDLCKTEIDTNFVDGKTKYGPWAIMCLRCHQVEGVGLGLGHGQLYGKSKEGWVKVNV
jgi:hypothetical protein